MSKTMGGGKEGGELGRRHEVMEEKWILGNWVWEAEIKLTRLWHGRGE